MNDCWIMTVARPQEIKERAPKIVCALLALFLTTGGNIRRQAIFSAEPIVLTHFGQTPRVLSRSYLVYTPQVSPRWRISECRTYLAKP